ncbi:MAG: hypothetical protein OXN88_17555 [Chloroflexota bacterium]|nr:hypothetical protein [Chloroflexota bacterium]
MMNDTRFQRMSDEYKAVRNVQDKIMDGLDEVLPAMARTIDENRQAIMENRQAIEQNRLAIMQANAKLDALIAHFDVDYKPTGFNPDTPEQ